jgi:hypothetical protein
MIVGIGYTFVVEGFVANLPGSRTPRSRSSFNLKSHLAGAGPGFAERMRELTTSTQDLLPPDEALRTLGSALRGPGGRLPRDLAPAVRAHLLGERTGWRACGTFVE